MSVDLITEMLDYFYEDYLEARQEDPSVGIFKAGWTYLFDDLFSGKATRQEFEERLRSALLETSE